MSDDLNPVMQALGRIEGKLDSEISSAKEHRDDDKRRFGEIYGRLDAVDADINKAKGAKGVLLWLIGGGAAAIGGLAAVAARAFGIK